MSLFRVVRRVFLVAFWGSVFGACTASLDFDALQSGAAVEEKPGTGDSESDSDGDDSDSTPPKECTSDGECDDDIDCTGDRCNASGVCVQEPDNSRCDGFDVCRVGEGCVDIGRECLTPEDCDDGIACTRESCTADGKCKILFTDDNICTDSENLCMTGMTCDETEGCVGGWQKPCTQDNGPSCYNYVCTPSTGECDDWVFRPGADKDNDGFCNADEAFGGDDCDDNSDAVNPDADEIPDNGVDDDCDGETDESDA